MKLTQKQKQVAMDRLKTIVKANNGMVCFCRGNNWTLNDTVWMNMPFNNGNIVIGGEQGILPSIVLLCNNCGNTIFMNAVKLGILPGMNDGSEGELIKWLKQNKDND